MKIELFETGWFGVPGSNFARDHSGKTHAVYAKDHRPICGVRMRPTMSFQFCAKGIYWDYIDCETCKARIRNLKKQGKVDV